MRLNVLGYAWRTFDGYGRYCAYMVQALRRAGVSLTPHFCGAADAPTWLQDEWGIDWSIPTISCLPPYYLRKLPQGYAPHWLLTMTEGSALPEGWAKAINQSGVERVIVPCEWNATAFRAGGVRCPVSVIHGGTDPDEFELNTRQPGQPYTFLALADRGKRKGWFEVYNAFFTAFGTHEEMGADKVRLIIKCRPGGNDLIETIREKCAWIDPRITFLEEDFDHIADFYARGDCFVIPSRAEGWGMPHREAAMMGLPVITQAYSGMDDGFTHEWALLVEGGRLEPIEAGKDKHIAGEWRVVDCEELARNMCACYDNPESAASLGRQSAAWLRANQTWDHSAQKLLQLLHSTGVLQSPALEREYA